MRLVQAEGRTNVRNSRHVKMAKIIVAGIKLGLFDERLMRTLEMATG